MHLKQQGIILILFLTIGHFNGSSQIHDLARSKSDEIINYIRDKQYNKVKECFLPQVLASISDSALKQLIDVGADFIGQYGLPHYEKVRIIVTPTSSFDKSIFDKDRTVLKFFEYPFSASPDNFTQRFISIGFIEEVSKNKIISLQVIDNSVKQ